MTYRHITNLRTPFDGLDTNLLSVIGDYRIGYPVPGNKPTSYDTAQLMARRIVGLYVTDEAIRKPDVVKLTGWKSPVLGKVWAR